MALATTTLAAAVAVGDSDVVVASATSVAAGRLILVDQEMMQVAQNYTTGVTVPVLRGRDGTAVKAHVITTNVTHGDAADFSTPAAGAVALYAGHRPVEIVSITTTGSLALPNPGSDMRVVINGTSVVGVTVPVPTKDMDGTTLTIVGNGVAAHTITFTGGLSGGGSGYDVLTTNATRQIAIQVVAANGLWVTLTTPAWTGTVTALVGGIA